MRHCAILCLREVARVDGMLKPLLVDVIIPLQRKVRQGEADLNARSGLAELLFVLSKLEREVFSNHFLKSLIF